MCDLINQVHKEQNQNENLDDEDEWKLEETTSAEDIEDFNTWIKSQAVKELAKIKDLTVVCDVLSLRERISSLNIQQRRIFDDLIERSVSSDIDEQPVFLFISGNAGTGKSHLVRVLIEAIKFIKMKPGVDLNKPAILVMAPTANAAFIIGGKTIDSTLRFVPMQSNRYIQTEPERLAKMKFLYEEVAVMFVDEISMVGSKKLTKMNYRLQELAEGEKKLQFMGGKSVIASGDMWQLPPIKDNIIFDNNKLDGRPELTQNHWKENFKIYYLTEKMRSKTDIKFSDLCDRVARKTIVM